jgi:hypothetical protein
LKVIFWKPKFRLPRSLKKEICASILKGIWSVSSYHFYLRFNVMNRLLGHYVGYIDTWQGWRPYGNHKSLKRRRKHFVVRVLDYGNVEETNDNNAL